MRKLKRIILHCSATEEGKDYTVAEIRRWHKKRGWKDIGYHYVIYRDGTIAPGRPLDQQGAHVTGENGDSIGICYIGGLINGDPKDTMTSHQEMSWLNLVHCLRTLFGPLTIHGHNEFANKACPSFTVAEKYNFLL